jgi:predicted aspartyl protease
MKEEFFPYRRLIHEVFGEIKIPSVELILKNMKEVRIYAIVDSGAVISLFPKSICDLLGLKYEEGKKASLISATCEEIPVRIHRVKIGIGRIEFDARVGFSEVEKVPHLLGRLDVFDKVEIKFEKGGIRFTSS